MFNIVLQNWGVIDLPHDFYTPPECRFKALSGQVYGHPCFKDGDKVVTSGLVSCGWDNGVFVVETRNTKYILGEISPEYLKWMEENGIKYNPDRPIKITPKD